jgi:hypothetical protein
MSLKHLAAAACALSALAVPSSALGKGPGAGSAPDPLPSGAPCATMRATPSVLRANRKATVDLRYNVSNCSGAEEAVSVTIAGSLQATAFDGTPVTCQIPSREAGTLTLRPNETRSLSVPVPASACPLGADGGTFTYEATASAADGSVLATETSVLLVRLAF